MQIQPHVIMENITVVYSNIKYVQQCLSLRCYNILNSLFFSISAESCSSACCRSLISDAFCISNKVNLSTRPKYPQTPTATAPRIEIKFRMGIDIDVLSLIFIIAVFIDFFAYVETTCNIVLGQLA